MKKWFNQTKRPIEKFNENENVYDWEDWGDQDDADIEIADAAEYEAEEAETVYYSEEAEVPVEGEYYAEEAPIEGEYYEETAVEGEYYEEAPMEGEYYEEAAVEGEYYEEAPMEGEYYEEAPVEGEYYEEAPVEGEYYEEEAVQEQAYYEDAAGTKYATSEKKAGKTKPEEDEQSGGIVGFFRELSVMDAVVAITGVAVLVLALVVGGMFLKQRNQEDPVNALASVGSQLEGIELIGEQGLLAVADAEKARIAAAEALKAEQEQQAQQEQNQGYDEEDYNKEVTVSLNLVSVQKDLKIKFTNKESGKLISNVPFVVTVTDPDGSNITWTDDDLDGIIYKKGITPGKYQVKVEALADAKYANYKLPASESKVEVKKEIVYQKIDVTNEIKTEKEVNAAQEDTKKNETVVESSLKDTVNWVESSVTANTYIEVAKSTIPDPAAGDAKKTTQVSALPAQNSPETSVFLASNDKVQRLTTYTAGINPSSQVLNVGGSFNITALCAEVSMAEVTWTSSNLNVATVVGNGVNAVVTAVGPGSAAISYTANGTAVSGGDAVTGVTGTCMVTVSEAKGAVTVENENVTVLPGAQLNVKATASGFAAGRDVVYTLAVGHPNVATATVDATTGNVTITGVAPGDAVITVFANYANGSVDTAAFKNINIKVINELKMELDKTEATVYVGEAMPIKAVIPNASAAIPVTVEITDTTIAAAAVEGHTVSVTGVNVGSAVLTVKYVQNGIEAKATCTIVVKVNPKNDKTTKLVDTNGEQLYVLENDKYREAVRADYYTADKFFVKGDVKYTGWQTISGKVYFFDATGKKVTGEQVIQGAKYNFASDGSLVTGTGTMGIDVSKWNGDIDWKAVKNSGISYVIIRCGYRGSSKGALIEDPKFKTNIEGAIAAGLKVGVYFFTQAVDEVEAVEEASMVLSMVSRYKISYPIFLDVEPSGGRGDKIDKATRTAVCKAFCKTIQEGGYTAGIYANKTWLNEKIDASALSSYKIWLAQYAATPTYEGKYDLWQYKSTGRVSGISGDVDLNLSYLGY